MRIGGRNIGVSGALDGLTVVLDQIINVDLEIWSTCDRVER